LNPSTIRILIYSGDWKLQNTVTSEGRYDRGIQDFTWVGNTLYGMGHDDWLLAWSWNPRTLALDLVEAIPDDLVLGGEGIEYDATNSRWYFMTTPDNTAGQVKIGTLDATAQKRIVITGLGGVGGLGDSPGVTGGDVDDYTQANIGVGLFRDGRFDDLALRTHTLQEPYSFIETSYENGP